MAETYCKDAASSASLATSRAMIRTSRSVARRCGSGRSRATAASRGGMIHLGSAHRTHEGPHPLRVLNARLTGNLDATRYVHPPRLHRAHSITGILRSEPTRKQEVLS